MAGENLIQNLLRQSFPESDKKSWEQVAMTEVDGAEPLEKLKWTDNDGNEFLSYYTREDILHTNYLEKFNRPADSDTFLGNRTWFNMPAVNVTEEVTANKIALEHLAAGADGIVFNLKEKQRPALDALLQNIGARYCRLTFAETNEIKFVDDVNEFVTKNKLEGDGISGNIFWGKIPQMQKNLSAFPRFGWLGIKVKSSTPVQEIANALSSAVRLLQLSSQPEITFRNISFLLSIDTNLVAGISKLKALRLLWYQVAQAYGLKQYKPGDLHLHAYIGKWINEKFQPHGNMIGSVTSSLAAIMGGCDAITVEPEHENSALMTRIARNVSNILREESYLDKVSDPLAGAYAIEVITDTFAKKAWSKFQNEMKNENT